MQKARTIAAVVLFRFAHTVAANGSMKAIRVASFGGPEVLRLVSVPLPTPNDHQIQVKILAAGVNPVETYIRQGAYTILPSLPYTPGNDGAGVITAVGRKVTNKSVGDRVWIAGSETGTYAQYCLTSPAQVFNLPEALSFAQGASLFTAYRTAYRALFTRATLQHGDRILIHGGSGAVGTAAIQLALNKVNCTLAATAGTQQGLDTIQRLGGKAFNHNEPGYIDQLKSFGPFNMVVEMLANVNLNTDIDLLAINGTIVVVGNRGTIDNVNMRKLMMTEGRIVGMVFLVVDSRQVKMY